MQPEDFISTQPADRQQLLAVMHDAILKNDKKVECTIEKMMGKEMIIYKCNGNFKYALASVKAHMSLHVLPIYGSPTLYSKYLQLLPEAKFQKGCINFSNEGQVPVEIIKQLIADCAKIDLAAIRAEYMKSKVKK